MPEVILTGTKELNEKVFSFENLSITDIHIINVALQKFRESLTEGGPEKHKYLRTIDDLLNPIKKIDIW
jgi:hypothetical protein